MLWLVVHLMYLVGFKHRVSAVMHWAVSFIGRGRSERAVTNQQVFGRLALERSEARAAEQAESQASVK